MSKILSKEEFEEQISENIDSLYKSYVDAAKKENKEPERMSSARRKLRSTRQIRSRFNPSKPYVTEEEMEKDISDLASAMKAEHIVFNVGKVVLMIAMKSQGM